MTRLRWIDWLVIGIVGFIIAFILISIVGLVNSGIELSTVYSPLIFPVLIGVSMLICWIITIILDLRKGTEHLGEDSKELFHDIAVAFFYVIAVIIYALVIGKLGFKVGTIIFMIIGMVYMNYDEKKMGKRIINATIASTITVFALHYVFYEIFRVMLP
jgi:hypothetical protein